MEPTSGGKPSCRLAVFAVPDDRHVLAGILEKTLGMHATDAMIRARQAPGFVADRLTAETAERLASEIRRIGLQAQAVDCESLPHLDHAEVIHHARCLETGLEILELHGSTERVIPWADVELISLGNIPQEKSRHYAVADMSAVTTAHRTSPAAMDVPLTPGPEVWILCHNPDRGYRIDHKRMNYESLGPRKTDSATANFRLFLDDVVAHTPHAYLTPATRAYLEHGSADASAFNDSAELQEATLLHWLIHRGGSEPPLAVTSASPPPP